MGIGHQVVIQPARRVSGTIRVPGDKSISHRYALLAALASGRSALHNFAPGSYRYEIDAVDYDGNVRYTAAGTFIVNGNVRVSN